MKQGSEWSNACGQQGIHQTIVKIEAQGVFLSLPLRKQPGPGNGKAVSLDAELAHQLDVFGIAMVMVTGNIAVLRALDLVRRVSKGVPDRGCASVLGNSTFDLIAGSRRSPQERLNGGSRHKKRMARSLSYVRSISKLKAHPWREPSRRGSAL